MKHTEFYKSFHDSVPLDSPSWASYEEHKKILLQSEISSALGYHQLMGAKVILEANRFAPLYGLGGQSPPFIALSDPSFYPIPIASVLSSVDPSILEGLPPHTTQECGVCGSRLDNTADEVFQVCVSLFIKIKKM